MSQFQSPTPKPQSLPRRVAGQRLNVSHDSGSPLFIPRVNHSARCCELPCVKRSGAMLFRHPLQPIVADRRGGVEALLDVALIELDASRFARVVGPDAA